MVAAAVRLELARCGSHLMAIVHRFVPVHRWAHWQRLVRSSRVMPTRLSPLTRCARPHAQTEDAPPLRWLRWSVSNRSIVFDILPSNCLDVKDI